MSRDSFAEDYAILVSKLGPALKLYHRNGMREYILPRGVVVDAVEAGLTGHLDATVTVGPHRFVVQITPTGFATVPLLIDQPAWQDAVDALHAAEGC